MQARQDQPGQDASEARIQETGQDAAIMLVDLLQLSLICTDTVRAIMQPFYALRPYPALAPAINGA